MSTKIYFNAPIFTKKLYKYQQSLQKQHSDQQ